MNGMSIIIKKELKRVFGDKKLVFSMFILPAIIMIHKALAVSCDRMDRAPFGPTPETLISFLKITRSSLSRKPNSCWSSSFTCI